MRTYEAVEITLDTDETYLTIKLMNSVGKFSGEQVGKFDTYEALHDYAASQGWLDGDDMGCWCQNCMGAGELTH